MGDLEDFDEEYNDEAEEEREKELGFRPQKEIIYNKLLPYGEKLDGESKVWWAEIKENLGRCIVLREIRSEKERGLKDTY